MPEVLSTKGLRYTYKTEPYSHQKKALKKLLDLNGSAGLFMDMATGKTKVAIDWAGIGFYNWNVRKVLVVAPLSVLGVWPRQIREHSGAPARSFRLGGKTEDRISLLKRIMASPNDDLLTYVIINYEGIWRENSKGTTVESLLIRWKPDLVIFDESHRLKSHSSKQSKSGHRISLASRQRLLLTGTSITKSPLDVFGQFRALRSEVFGTNWYQFKFAFGVWGGRYKYQLRGYRNIGLLINKIRKHSFRIKKEQCLDLPEKVFETVPVQLTDKERNYYNKMAKESIIEIEETHATAAIVLTKMLRLRQITSGFVKDVDGIIRDLGQSKLNTCIDLLNDLIEEDHKVVVFCEFLHDIKRISERLTVDYDILSGSVPPLKRDSLIERFQTDPKMKVLIAQLQTGSEGIELMAADAAIYYSLSHNALYYWQSQDRLHRPGQTKNVVYYHLIVPKSVDDLVLAALKAKKQVAEMVLHHPRKFLRII